MDLVQAIDTRSTSYSADYVMNILFERLDEALEDYENGRVISEEQMLKELANHEKSNIK